MAILAVRNVASAYARLPNVTILPFAAPRGASGVTLKKTSDRGSPGLQLKPLRAAQAPTGAPGPMSPLCPTGVRDGSVARRGPERRSRPQPALCEQVPLDGRDARPRLRVHDVRDEDAPGGEERVLLGELAPRPLARRGLEHRHERRHRGPVDADEAVPVLRERRGQDVRGRDGVA